MVVGDGREEDASTSPEDSNRLDEGEDYLAFKKDAASNMYEVGS